MLLAVGFDALSRASKPLGWVTGAVMSLQPGGSSLWRALQAVSTPVCCASVIFVTCHAMKKMGTWFVSVPHPIQHVPSSTTILRRDTVFLALGVTALVEKIRHTGLDRSKACPLPWSVREAWNWQITLSDARFMGSYSRKEG